MNNSLVLSNWGTCKYTIGSLLFTQFPKALIPCANKEENNLISPHITNLYEQDNYHFSYDLYSAPHTGANRPTYSGYWAQTCGPE